MRKKNSSWLFFDLSTKGNFLGEFQTIYDIGIEKNRWEKGRRKFSMHGELVIEGAHKGEYSCY